jgi:hypothetical protein
MIIPVLAAVSQATLEKGSCSKQASSYKICQKKGQYNISQTTYDGIGNLVANFIRMTFTDRLGGEQKVVWGELSVGHDDEDFAGIEVTER